MSAPPQSPPPPSDKPPKTSEKASPRAASLVTGGRVRLAVAGVLLVGWLGWLSVTALTKSRAPIVSHAQAAVAKYQLVAEVEYEPGGGPTGKATVKEVLSGDGP